MLDHINALVLPVRDVEKCTTFYRDKLDFNLDQLEREGVYFVNTSSTKYDGWRTAHFADPEGNLWEIAQGPKK